MTEYEIKLQALQQKNNILVTHYKQMGYCKSREYRRRLRKMVKRGTIGYWVERAFEVGAIRHGERLELS